MPSAPGPSSSSRLPGSQIPPRDGPVQRPMYALLLRLGAGATLATMLMLVKLVSARGVDLPHILLFRQAVSVPVLLGFLIVRGEMGRLRSNRLVSHGIRALTGSTGMALTFGAPILLPLAVSTTLGFTSPIFAVVLSALLLHEKVGRWRWSAVLLGFAGIAIIAGPGGTDIDPLGAAVGIAAAFMVALISIQIRDLSRTEDSIAIVVYFALFSAPVLFIVSLFFPWPTDWTDYALLLLVGGFGTAAQLFLTNSLRYGTVSSVIVMDYAMLIWATLYGWLVFDNLPSVMLWFGAPLVIAAGAIIVWREHRLSKTRSEFGEL